MIQISKLKVGVVGAGSWGTVIAIACGISLGLGLGLNTRAALITRGLTEIRRLGLKLGAEIPFRLEIFTLQLLKV